MRIDATALWNSGWNKFEDGTWSNPSIKCGYFKFREAVNIEKEYRAVKHPRDDIQGRDQ